MLIQSYQSHWSQDFQNIKQILVEAVKPFDVVVEHIGSTAVPELAAKPILDIDIVYQEDVKLEAIKAKLEAIGYFHNGDQGIPQREVFKRRNTSSDHSILDEIAHHLYVCPAESFELQRHLAFRDYLIAHPEAREQYQHLKYKIAEDAHQDRKMYAQLKETQAYDFIHEILSNAIQSKF